MGPAVDAFETALLSGLLRHNGNPVLNWEAGDVVVDTDPAGNRKAIKGRSFDKIHGIVAAIMACGLAQKHEQAPEPWFCDLPPRPWARNLQAEFARTVLPADWSWSWAFQAFSRAIPRPVGRRTRSRWMPAFWTRTRCARLKGTIQGRSCQ
jgi:hypothetical protein